MPPIAAVILVGMFISCIYVCMGVVIWKELQARDDSAYDTDPTDLPYKDE